MPKLALCPFQIGAALLRSLLEVFQFINSTAYPPILPSMLWTVTTMQAPLVRAQCSITQSVEPDALWNDVRCLTSASMSRLAWAFVTGIGRVSARAFTGLAFCRPSPSNGCS